ncbi:MAG: chitobiase/beta-hexosaminidase C-terminal domain-containing protein [Patescibacteria group bacterium]|jgi:hypothetical protein
MAIITISLTSFGPYFISGIPRQVELETNIPAIIFYSLDGSDPSYFSPIYLGPINLPTDNSVRLRVWAVSGEDSGTLDVTFSVDNSKLFYPRRSKAVGSLGIAVDAYGVPVVLVDGYGVDAYNNVVMPVRRSDYPLYELEIKYSTTGPDGYGPGTMFVLGAYPSEFWQDDAVSEETSSPNNMNVFFNPRSLYIVIDGRNGYDDESIHPIMKPWAGTLDPTKYLQGKTFFQPNPFISGGLVRSCFNYSTGVAVFYYFDSVECRWIKSIQNFDTSTVPQRIGDRRQYGPPLVIPWIYNRRSMI